MFFPNLSGERYKTYLFFEYMNRLIFWVAVFWNGSGCAIIVWTLENLFTRLLT